MNRRLTIPAFLGLAATLAPGGEAHALGRSRGGQTYHYNGSRGYYTPAPAAPAQASACGCGAPAPHVHYASNAPVYYAPRATYAAPRAVYAPAVSTPGR